MSANATIRVGYRARLLAVCIGFIAIGGWFLYDAAVGYPLENQRLRIAKKRLETLREQYPQTWSNRWRYYAREHDFPERASEIRNRELHSQSAIALQWILAGVTIPIGVVAGVAYVRIGRRWISTDLKGVHTSDDRHAPWDSIQWVDKSRWHKKGIAVIHYMDHGVMRRITLDDWKYYREPTAQVLTEVERHLAERGDATGPGEHAQPDADAATHHRAEAGEHS